MKSLESQMQARCVIEFSQKYPERRGHLFAYFATSDSYIQASQKLSLGLVKGCSDLLYINNGQLIGIEMKATGTSHNRVHLIEQCQWLLKVPKTGWFCDSVEMFWQIINGWYGIDPKRVLENCMQKKTGSVKWDEVK